MFFESIISALTIFKYWEIWLVVFAYVIILFLFLLLSSIFFEGENPALNVIGGVVYLIGGTALQGIVLSFIIAFILPILLGGDSLNSISIVSQALWPITKAGLLAIVIVTLLCLIPIIGAFISNSNGIQTFLEGIIIFKFFSGQTINEILVRANIEKTVYPNFFETILFLLIAGTLVKAILLAVTFIATLFEESKEELIIIAIGPALGVIGGLLPLFMYCSYVRLSIINLISH